jgi:hypothetical protein
MSRPFTAGSKDAQHKRMTRSPVVSRPLVPFSGFLRVLGPPISNAMRRPNLDDNGGLVPCLVAKRVQSCHRNKSPTNCSKSVKCIS